MTKVLNITAEQHGEAAFELYNYWHADALIKVSDERLGGEDFETTVAGLLQMLADLGWNLHGYTVGGPGENGSWVKNQAGKIVIELV